MAMPQSADRIKTINITFPITFSALCALLAIILTGIYYYITADKEKTLVFFASSIAVAAQITATFYTARTLSATIAQNKLSAEKDILVAEQGKQAIRYDILKYTARFGERWNDASMYPARDVLRKILEYNGSLDELLSTCDNNKTHVIHILNFIEEIATSRRIGLIDEPLAKANFDSVVILTWRKLSPWIGKYRNDVGVNGLWEEVEVLANMWKNPQR